MTPDSLSPFIRKSTLAQKGVAPLRRLSAYLRGLPPGDRLIAGVLGIIVVIACLVSLLALMRTFMVEVPAHGGTLTEGVVGAPRFVNPLLALTDTDRDLTMLTHAGLMGYDAQGELVPVLAEGFVRSEDQRSYTFTIRGGAEFSDGTPVTAEDVVFTVNRAQDPNYKSPVLSNWASIRVEALDARTVLFTLPRPYAPFLEDATLGILPEHVWKDVSPEEFAFSPYMAEPVGAGPFTVSRVSRDKNGAITSVELSASRRYVFGRPHLDHIRFVVFPDTAALANAIRSGRVESAHGIATPNALNVPYSRIFGVFFNPAQDAIYVDQGVREALSRAIDREALVADVLGGYATPSVGPVPAGSGVPELPLPNPATRVEDARAILEGASWKWTEEGQAWVKDGTTLSVTLTTSNVPELKAIATRIERDWNAIGVPVVIELHQPAVLTQSVIRPRAYGALLFGEVVGTYPDLYAFWFSGERNDPGLNIAGYANREVDELLEEARTQSDQTLANEALARANELIAADYPAAFTHTPDFLYAFPEDLRGLQLARIAEPSDRFRTAPYWYRQTEWVWPLFAR
jgi:peptide/nickel transport system substrate-binding protein